MIAPYQVLTDADGHRFVRVTGRDQLFETALVPRGYECDGATIPHWLWWLTGDPFSEPRVKAAIKHDWLYENMIGTRSLADGEYRRDLISLGMQPWKAWTEWMFVRAFGWSHWGS